MKKLEIVIVFNNNSNYGFQNLERVLYLIERENRYTYYNIIMDFSELANGKMTEKFLEDFEILRKKVISRKQIIINGDVRINKNCLTVSFIKRLPASIRVLEINDEMDVEKKICKYKERLSRKGCSVVIRTSETEWEKILERYRVVSKMELSLTAPYFDSYSDIGHSDFSEWIYNVQDSELSVFYNICRKYLEGIPGRDDCFHNSCLGKYILVGYDGEVYCCKNKNENMKHSNINKVSSFMDIFNNDRFLTIMTDVINRRDRCREKCELFEQCRSGCPIKDHNGGCNNESYKDYYLAIIKILKNVIKTEDYTLINASLRKLIFSSMVSGRLLAEKGKINES